MDHNSIKQNDSLYNTLVTYEIKKHLQDIELDRKNSEIDVSIEKKILSVAKNYEKGVFEKCDYMKPNEAYECIRYLVEFSSNKSLNDYIHEVESDLNNMSQGKGYNRLLMKEYIKCIMKVVESKSMKESEFKRCGREYELFDFK